MKNKKPADKEPSLLAENLTLEIIGFNHTRILNTLNAEGVPLSNIKRLSPKHLRLDVRKKDSVKTFAILDKMCYNYTIVRQTGYRVFLKNCVKHIGFVAGLVVFSALAFLWSGFIWKVDIYGNEAVDSQLIERELKECGIKPGAFKSRLDTEAVASRLRSMDGIAEGTAELKGTTLYIRVLEQKEYIPPVQDELPADIVSGYDAEITRIVVEKGTGTVGIGAKVSKGAPLIKGEIYNTNGEVMEACRARGQVYGKVAFSQTHIFSAVETFYEHTGKIKKFTTLSLFSLTLGGKNIPAWEKEVSEEKLFLLPIKVTQTICRETRLVERERDIAAHIETLKRQAVLESVIKAGGSEVETVTTLTPMDEGLYMLNIYIVGEMLLGSA